MLNFQLHAVLLTAALAATASQPAAAEKYRLIMGDQLIVDYDFLDAPKTVRVDIDGEIRLPELGSLGVAGLTLDEVESTVVRSMAEDGFSGDPVVSVEIESYAPVTVSGFVEQAGRYDYLPGMRVATAVAVAGGPGTSEFQSGPPEFAARRRLADAINEIERSAVAVAGLEAALQGAAVAVRPVTDLPMVDRERVEALLEEETARLAAERARIAMMVRSLEEEIADFTEQMKLLDNRIDLKTTVVADLEAEFADLESLRTQGLATTARTSLLRQRLADDREELLSLEIAKVQARRNRALAERRLNEVIARQDSENREALRTARADLAAARQKRVLALEEIATIGSLTSDPSAPERALELRFTVLGPRAGRFEGSTVARDTPLLPGDTLLVDGIISQP